MKIFNWVHRKFHNKDGLNGDVKKAEHVTYDTDTQALLEQVALADVIAGWGQGILTIGTFGFDPLKDFKKQKEIELIGDEENEPEEYDEQSYTDDESCEIDEEEEGELNPLVFKAFKHGIKKNIGSHCDQNAQESGIILAIDGIPLSPKPHELGADSNNLEFDKRKNKGERITLADLFSADSDMHKTPDHGKIQPEAIQKPEPRAKTGLSFAKKLIPQVKEDSRPIKKIHRMMARMLKRKIHPELEGKNQKKENQIKHSVLGLLRGGNGAFESVSLLQTQDAIACA